MVFIFSVCLEFLSDFEKFLRTLFCFVFFRFVNIAFVMMSWILFQSVLGEGCWECWMRFGRFFSVSFLKFDHCLGVDSLQLMNVLTSCLWFVGLDSRKFFGSSDVVTNLWSLSMIVLVFSVYESMMRFEKCGDIQM